MKRETAAHIEAQRRLRGSVSTLVAQEWKRLPNYSDEENVERFTRAAAGIVRAGQRSSVSVTESYFARLLKKPPRGVDADAVIARSRNGAKAEEVYHRAFVTVWSALKEGTPWEDAVKAGLERATAAAATDIQLAMRETAREIGEGDSGIHGFARVPNGAACELCLIAATQTYHTSDLMPIHDRCGCSVEPIFSEFPSSPSEIAGDDGTTVRVEDHGELGPVLTNADHEFTAL